jgi:hypothetical protein
MAKSILTRILDEATLAKHGGEPFLAVFDLDSTLFDLTLRISKIVEDFWKNAAHRELFPKECEALKSFVLYSHDWGLSEALARVGLDQPHHAEFLRLLHQHWADCFFSGSHLHHDEPLPGALEYVQALLKTGAHIMYLTGRDVPRMMEGTLRILRERGFPVDDHGVETILKPDAAMDDARFKADVLAEAAIKYGKIWLFENEPVNLNLVAKELPQIGLVYIESTHSGREQVAETLARIKHFEVESTEFENYGRGK